VTAADDAQAMPYGVTVMYIRTPAALASWIWPPAG
jgi:hypothetical protein